MSETAAAKADPLFAAGQADQAEAWLRDNIRAPGARARLREFLVAERREAEASELAENEPDALDRALAAHRAGDFRAAVGHCREHLAQQPDDPAGLLYLARSAHNLGDSDRALEWLRQCTRLAPGFAEGWHALAHALRARGQLPEACQAWEKALNHSPGLQQARLDLGLTLLNLDRPADALGCFEALIESTPEHVDALAHAGLALHILGRPEAAARKLERALSLDPESPEAHHFLASLRNDAGDAAAAEKHLEQALKSRPGDPELLAELADLYELDNRLDDARAAVEQGLNTAPGYPRLVIASARLARRAGDPQACLDTLRRLDVQTLPPRLAMNYFQEAGLSLDRLEDTDQAVQALTLANRINADSPRARAVDRSAYFAQLDAIEGWLERTDRTAPAADGPGRQLCFLIGMPRSGTTLLDTMLDAHPDVATVEEKPTMESVIATLAESPAGYPEAIDELGESELEDLRARYLERLHDHTGPSTSGLIVDKLPLRLVHTALIRRLFPGAKMLLILRHPCDVVLSNFMQLFEPTEAFVQTDTLEGAAQLYDRVMSLWTRLRPLAEPVLETLRYESLVADPAGELERVCAFLGVDFHPDMVDDKARLANRDRVRTNSYYQVAETVHGRSAGRWLRYRAHLEPHLARLRPHAEALGYPLD